MIQFTGLASSSGLVTKTRSVQVIIVVLSIIFGVGGYNFRGGYDGDSDEVSQSPYSVINPGASWASTGEKSINDTIGKSIEGELQGKSKSFNSSSGGHTNNISDYIRNGELSGIFCERCTESQKEKVEQILYLLYHFNNNAGSTSASNVKLIPEEIPDKNYVLLKKKKEKKKFKATSSPIPVYRKNLPEMIPTPETVVSSYHDRQQLSRVIQLPPSTLSTTTPATSSPGYSSMAIPIVPYFYTSTATSPLPGGSTTVSSALEPAQSVEMPTPPMPPTTTGPVYLYYLGGPSSTSSLSSSGSLEPPTTPVMESSVAYASRPTTMEPIL